MHRCTCLVKWGGEGVDRSSLSFSLFLFASWFAEEMEMERGFWVGRYVCMYVCIILSYDINLYVYELECNGRDSKSRFR